MCARYSLAKEEKKITNQWAGKIKSIYGYKKKLAPTQEGLVITGGSLEQYSLSSIILFILNGTQTDLISEELVEQIGAKIVSKNL